MVTKHSRATTDVRDEMNWSTGDCAGNYGAAGHEWIAGQNVLVVP